MLTRLRNLFDAVDLKLIRASGTTTLLVYIVHYMLNKQGDSVCINKIAMAFAVLFAYLIIEPLIIAIKRGRKHNDTTVE